MTAGCTVKLCGTTSRTDAGLAAEAGADWFGVVVEVGFSARSLSLEAARPLFNEPPIPAVALVFEMAEPRLRDLITALTPCAVQFLSQEDPDLLRRLKRNFPGVQLWQSIHLPPAGADVSHQAVMETVRSYIAAGVDVLLFDTAATVDGTQKYGGTGMIADWQVIRRVLDQVRGEVPVLLAGGIRPDNVKAALEAVAPDGIDLCSGVESRPGRRDPAKVAALMQAVQNA
ncbi:MAG: phosphoribosylanthranilate isomerase [Syntrophotaleaceae bacterium]